MLDKSFEIDKAELAATELWEQHEAFKAGIGAKEGSETYSIILPPPNVTGVLHVGHALDATIQDLLIRYSRMRKLDTLWQPGLDHAGIATQMVVERQLAAANQPGRRELGREKFLEKVWEWKEQSGGQILEQFKRLGVSFDWSRVRFTMDEGSSAAVIEAFVRLHKDGLLYRDKRLVNWDCALGTAISDLEVEAKEVAGHLWYIRYPLADRNFDPEDPSTYIVVATTRPETLLGDSAVAVHPDDDRYNNLPSMQVRLPLVGRLLPIVLDDYADMETGSGAVKITPAHDFNDFEVGTRHNLPLINILTTSGTINLSDNAEFLEGLAVSEQVQNLMQLLHGMDRFAARKLIVEKLAAAGYLQKIEEYTHIVPHGDRSGTVIEPFLTQQWYVDAATLARPAMEAVRNGQTNIIPASSNKIYFNWLENIKPWCVSRQLWWGHRIPAWYGPDGKVFVERSEEDAIKAANIHYGEAVELSRDEDVLDTWFSSALWPLSTLGWPNTTKELDKYYPTSVLVSGFDIVFFWVARMMMFGLHFAKQVPFKTIYLHALVRDEHGAKMSKSKGNVIDPLVLVDKYGADALRFSLASQLAQGRDLRLDESRVAGYRNFATKLWNASRFAQMNACFDNSSPALEQDNISLRINKWLLTLLSNTVKEVESALDQFRFNDAALSVYQFTWNQLCDWYIELVKPILNSGSEADKAECLSCLRLCLETIYKILHPFMPFLTETLWQQTRGDHQEAGCLALQEWPVVNFSDQAAVEEITFVINMITEVRSVKAKMNIAPSAQMELVAIDPPMNFKRIIEANLVYLQRLGRIKDLTFAANPPLNSLKLVVSGIIYSIPVDGLLDLEVELARLNKKKSKLDSDLAGLSAKLNNQQFLSKASLQVVEAEQARYAQLMVEAEKLNEALSQLQSLQS